MSDHHHTLVFSRGPGDPDETVVRESTPFHTPALRRWRAATTARYQPWCRLYQGQGADLVWPALYEGPYAWMTELP